MFRLGRLRGARGPLLERTRWVNLQVDTADIPPQDLITMDNVPVRVKAAVFFRVVDPVKAAVEIRRLRAWRAADRPGHAPGDPRSTRSR